MPKVAPFVASLALLAWGLAPAGPAPGRPSRIREAMRDDRMSKADYERMERGYYESLRDAGRRLDEVLSRRPEVSGLWTPQPLGGADRP